MWDLWDPCDYKRCERNFCPGLAQQGRVPDGVVWMFCCIPLRTCVFLNCLGTVFASVSLSIAHKLFEADFRTFTGGYALQSRVIISVIEVVGIFAGLLGLIGTVTLESHCIKFYQMYQIVRLGACFLMYVTDVPLLLHCELFRTNLPKAIEEYDWNPLMFDLALNNRCSQERMSFVIASTVYLLLFVYLTSGTSQFLSELEEEPRYLLRVPKGRASASFNASALASRSMSERAKKMEDRLDRETAMLDGGGGLVGAPVRTMGALPERLPDRVPSFGGFGIAPQTVPPWQAPMGSFMGAPGAGAGPGRTGGPGALEMRL